MNLNWRFQVISKWRELDPAIAKLVTLLPRLTEKVFYCVFEIDT